GNFMHSPLPEHADGPNAHDPGLEGHWGAEYGPYLLPRYFQGSMDRCTIYFTMSTWNPYQVVLMQADIGYHEVSPATNPGTNPTGGG
ncbi:MAG TPA: DUF4185 domain-containing protein, partial [Candidatus Hydrogenedentes bacterium]|nr:DUF4185 domain-containing protein [Candidatus Hydrogenedentota bacterium]